MPPTLIGLAYLDGMRPPNIPYNSSYVDLTRPDHALKDWKILVQGSQVLFVSPPGWRQGEPTPKKPPEGAPSVIVQIPRARVALYWSGVEGDVGQLERWPPAAAKQDGKAR